MEVPLRDKTGVTIAIAIIDADDVLLVLGYRWYLDRDARGKPTYATTYVTANHKERMHRMILGLKRGDPEVDHANGNKLDNRRANLRPSTRSQNQSNRQKTPNKSSSPYKGVYWNKNASKWMAQCGVAASGQRYLGLFTTQEEAAHAYDEAARRIWGEFACLNFPNERMLNG